MNVVFLVFCFHLGMYVCICILTIPMAVHNPTVRLLDTQKVTKLSYK